MNISSNFLKINFMSDFYGLKYQKPSLPADIFVYRSPAAIYFIPKNNFNLDDVFILHHTLHQILHQILYQMLHQILYQMIHKI